MELVRDERMRYPWQIAKGLVVAIKNGDEGDGAVLHLTTYAPSDLKEDVTKLVAARIAEKSPEKLHVLVVHVKDTDQVALALSKHPFGEFMYDLGAVGWFTESECEKRLRNHLQLACDTRVKRDILIKRTRKAGFATDKGRMQFIAAVQSMNTVIQCELQSARDITECIHNVQLASPAAAA